MKKIIVIVIISSCIAFGMSYKEFKRYAQKNAKSLQSQSLSLQTKREENKILLRTKNPTIDIEVSQFNPDGTSSTYGYSATATQSIRTENYYGGLKEKTEASALLQQAYIADGRAGYIRTLEMLYTEYVYQSKSLTLLQEEYSLAERVTNMVNERYKSGSETKVSYLQARTDTLTLKTQIYTIKQERDRLYYQLLAVAGLKKKVSLDKKFIYDFLSKTKHSIKTNTKENMLKAKEKLLQSQVHINESSINSYDLYAQMESEPDQSIARIGISIPMPLFNKKSEEKQLAKLQLQQLSLDKEQLQINLNRQKEQIEASIKELSAQYSSLKTLKDEQQILYNLLQEGYKIAQGSLFVMMNAKNKLIQTAKSLLQTHKMINNQKIELRFIQGAYNE